MKRLLIAFPVMMLILGLVGLAYADKPPLEKPLVPFQGLVRSTEIEPNDDCTTATPLMVGDPVEASIDPVGDMDWFEFTATAGECVRFETHPGEGQVGGDTQMYLFADDCVTQLAYDDDGGDGLYSYFQYTFTDAGTFYVRVNEYGNNGLIGAYVMTADNCPEPPPNDTCAGAIDLREQGLQTFEVDLCTYYNDYTPAPPECTNDYTANGPEAVYKIYLVAGETFNVCEDQTSTFIDLSIWLVSDCGDPENTCVAGEDNGNPECINYTAAADGWYFLMVDTYSGCGVVAVTIDAPIATEDRSWGSVKELYK
jgi:hypothetical protein